MADWGVNMDRLLDDPGLRQVMAEVTEFALYELDTEGICVRWESYSANYRANVAAQVVGRPLSDFYPEGAKPGEGYGDNLRRAVEFGRADGEGWRLRLDGGRAWMRFVILAKRDEAGELTGFVGFTYDASRQKSFDDRLSVSEKTFRLLVQGIKDHAIYMLDRTGRVTNWNPGAERIKGYTEDEIVGEHFSKFYTQEDRDAGKPARALFEARESGEFHEEGWRIRKDGTRFRADVTIQPIYDDDGRFAGFSMQVRDISEWHETGERLAQANEALLQSQKMRSLGELTGGIAHDFNNLLTVVRGSAELLKSDRLTEEKRLRHVNAIIETADRAAELTSQLLSFARRQPLQPQVINLNAMIADMSDLIARSIGSNIRVLNATAPDLWQIKADPTQLRNLILNAAINARDAMEEQGTLTITTRNVSGENGEEVRLSISDTGMGMPPDVRARVFEPFFTTKGPGKGTGLGLSQAYGFAVQSGGRIDIASTEGRGTTLKLFLPRHHSVEEIVDAPVSETGDAVPRGTRILLVEDSRTVAQFAQSLLEDMGCEIVHAASAEEARIALQDDPAGFDIVFSDIVMPGDSGLDLAAEVRQQKPTLPILLATGYSEAAARGEGGEFPIMPKPYRRETLETMLGKTLRAFQQAA